jgi:RNA polymerase sigma factor (sigma-70 family)
LTFDPSADGAVARKSAGTADGRYSQNRRNALNLALIGLSSHSRLQEAGMTIPGSDTDTDLLAAVRAGRGPLVAFRAYLHTTLRHVCYHRARRDRRIEFTDDLTRYDAGEPFRDPALDLLERTYAARAFQQLPARWRDILWQTEVEGASPAEIAPRLGLTPNAVAVLAHRAREGLRRLYLQQHVTVADQPECRWAGDRLGGHVRGRLAARDTARLHTHLGWCAGCRSRLAEVAEVQGLRDRPYRQRHQAESAG